jgi:ubiquinone/menaquinone biosynthesis C-methylase UbiE
MTQGKYVGSELNLDTDRQRLSFMEQTWDPTTIRHLETLGVAKGWTCLEVGAGYGSITCWLADRVGTKGKVVATDIRPALIRETTDNVEIRQHDILRDELEKGCYDLVHCRALLQHLSDPEAALSRMADAVRPGGWLLIEELDGAGQATDITSSSAEIYNKYVQFIRELAKKRGIMDPWFGRRVRQLIDRLHFEEVRYDGFTPIVRGGDPSANELLMTLKAGRGLVAGTLFPEEMKIRELRGDQFEHLLQDPSFYFVNNTLFSAWGKKPA